MSPIAERRLLQVAIALAGFVPVGAGLQGAILGTDMTGADMIGAAGDPALDSMTRYLSGLLLGIGLAFWDAIPTIEERTARVRLLTAIVALGGLMRLLGVFVVGYPGGPMTFGLCMELVVTPLICLWQTRVARRCGARYRAPTRA